MPDTLPRPDAAGPSFPVKHLAFRHDKNIFDSPSSSTRSGPITAIANGVSLQQSDGQDLTHFGPRASTCGEHSPLLSERESIFATHYTPVENDTSTPRLPPLAGAVTEPTSPEALEPDMEFSLPPLVPTPSKLSIRSSLTAARSGSAGITGGVKQYGHIGSEKSADKQMSANNGTIHKIRRVASDGTPWTRSSHVAGSHPNLDPGSINPQNILSEPTMEGDKAQPGVNAVQPREEQEQEHRRGQGAHRQSAMSQAMRPTRSERSLSRGRTHVDKSIEATLANTEPGQNIRSRKSSHLMGVFRENTTSLETRTRDTNLQHGGEADDEVHAVSRPALPSGRTSSRPTSTILTAANLASTELVYREDARVEQNQLSASTQYHILNIEPSTQASTAPSLPQTSPTQSKPPSKHDHDPYFRKQDAVKQSKGFHDPPIPANLLEQIREVRNMIPTRSQGSHIPKDRSGLVGHGDTDFANRQQLRTGDLGVQADETEEHISSAVYFPHPGPSLEDIEQFNLPEESKLYTGTKTDVRGPLAISAQTHNEGKKSTMDLAPPEHIDISVQSKHEKRVFHGDYQPPDDIHDEELDREALPTINERPTESYSVASDSEVESGEDIGVASQTDDGEITPTATPVVASQTHRGKRPSISIAYKGAVVLEPYSHQVGGHSTIFRFSRRAVCKQLNNRENEFYERIERRHPDMLRFLPRYIGVLNVTFSKGPKPTKDSSGEVHRIVNESKGSTRDSEDTVTHDKKSDELYEKKDQTHIAENEQRIVSQSQQIGERPQVILEQNRHIVPFSLFDSAERLRSTEHWQSIDRRSSKSDPGEPEGSRSQTLTPSVDDPPPRPPLPSPPSWGKTTVNSKFGEQILRDVFGPPPIHHHKKHAKGHSTLPRLRESSARRSNIAAEPINDSRRTGSIPADEHRIPAQADNLDSGQAGNVHEKALDIPTNITSQDTYLNSASAFEDLSHGLEKMRTTNSMDSEGSQVGHGNNKIRRRHSGMGLRRRGRSVHDKSRGNLEYYEEDGYGGDGEEELFRMEEANDASRTVSATTSSTVPQNFNNATSPITVPNEHSNVQATPSGTSTSETMKHAVPEIVSSASHLPPNPKEAQLAKPDQRVVFFLLLEDLTADMGRPCVLDLKMGTRQYGIEATPKKMESQRRKCKTTTSLQLGVRICGMQTFNVKKQQPAYEDKYFGRDLKAGREFREALTRFLYDGVSYSSVTKRIPTILDKISKLESMVRRLPGYRFYASSLLMLYDAEPEKSQRAKEEAAKARGHGKTHDEEKEKDKDRDKKWPPPIELKIVDFANCVTGEDPLPPNAPCPPCHPKSVDRGYLRGLRTLKMYFQRILRDVTESEFIERGDGDATGVDMIGAGGSLGSETIMEEDDGEVSI